MPTVNGDLIIDFPHWAEDLLEGKARYRGAYGGRGGGKSHVFADLIIDTCVYEKKNIVCIREVQNTLAQSAKRLIEDKIKHHMVGHLFEVQQSQIKVYNGGVIIFNGMQDHNAESIKSLEGFDIAWIEEAQSLSQRSLDLLRPTIRKDNSEIWASWNPRYETDPIDKLLRGATPPPDSRVIMVNHEDNPWFPSVLLAELNYDKERDYEKYLHVWRGEYLKNSEARVFKNWRVEEFPHRDDVVRRQGADWGFSVDPTTLINAYAEGRTLYIEYEAYKVGCELDDIPKLFKTVPESQKWPIVADSNRPDTISHVRKNGYPKIVPASKGAGSIEDGVEHLQNYNIVVHPRCKHTIDELTHYSYKVDPHTDQVLPVLTDKKNHVIDALRYADEGYRRVENVQTINMENVFRWENDAMKDKQINIYMIVLTPSKTRDTKHTTIVAVRLGDDGVTYLLDGLTDVMTLQQRSEKMIELHRKWNPIATAYDEEGYELDYQYHEAVMEQTNYRFPSISVKIKKEFTEYVKLFIPTIESGKYYTPKTVKYINSKKEKVDFIAIHDAEMSNYPFSVSLETLLCVALVRSKSLGAVYPELISPFGRDTTMAKTEYSLFGD